ncbi:ribosomal subunit interface protein [Candidatus Kaiserbacteria bacterium RIFCSPHIGHO2_01_FULL_46_22]|uniref:Ribosomal subunit interface protein n=1 Tax=Candidatus Kaiserbacteria bacterium RIFCSPHIGHO2_01_FULL_46_22 TaxID=1798475 RepID=A0A1F6BZK6_9BACT|nr:MAG: ribosomal subunit interface protein [Candidatus Kaiserbacteria bacterium RIFCSPHIGHO2_01_FULL_46_22]
MSFPMINFKITNAEVSDQLKNIAEHKLAALDKYFGDSPAVCDLEFERITNHHQQGNIFRVEINLEVSGKLFRAEATSETFERAIDEVKSDIEHRLESERGKREALWKRGARRVKEMMQWGG